MFYAVGGSKLNTLSNLAKQKILRLETYAKFPYLITVTLPDDTVWRFVNCDEDVVYDSHTYTAGYFEITPPNRTNTEIGDGKLTISTIDQTWIEQVRNITERAKLAFVACILYNDSGSVDTIEAIDELSFELVNASWDGTSMSFDMKYDEGMSIVLPCDTANAQKVPALG